MTNKVYFKIIIILLFVNILFADEQPQSKVIRPKKEIYYPSIIYSSIDYQLVAVFALMQKANNGDITAQHELGLRYLLGRGILADTSKALYWIKKAAEKNLPIAQYNLGVFYVNGIGVEWNPFEAYKYYKLAANNGFPEALLVMGIIYAEGLIVQRNYLTSYNYLKKSAIYGCQEAKQAIEYLEKSGYLKDTLQTKTKTKKTKTNSNKKDYNFLFFNYESDTTDRTDSLINNSNFVQSTDTVNVNNSPKIDTTTFNKILIESELGNPESLCLLGMYYERGFNTEKNLVMAALCYLRALNNDSFRAYNLLNNLLHKENFYEELERKTKKNDVNAFYVWFGLTAGGFSNILNEKQAMNYLHYAANQKHIPSILELGLCYLTGKGVTQNKDSAIVLWNHAAILKNKEAVIRLATAQIIGQIDLLETCKQVEIIQNAVKEGSVFASLALGYCYEKGICVEKNKLQATKVYMNAVRKGSMKAFTSLKNMYDAIRPDDQEFVIED